MLPAVHPTRQRRRFSREFKRQLVDQCQPGVSVAGIAMINGINPNQLHRWIRQLRAAGDMLPARINSTIKLVPLSVEPPQSSGTDSVIEITLSGKRRSASLRWPVSAASALMSLLTDLLS